MHSLIQLCNPQKSRVKEGEILDNGKAAGIAVVCCYRLLLNVRLLWRSLTNLIMTSILKM